MGTPKPLKIKCERVVDSAKLPERSIMCDHSYDLVATSVTETPAQGSKFGFVEYGTGIKFKVPHGYVGLLFPKPSIKYSGLVMTNCVGVIGPQHNDEVVFTFKYISGTNKYIVGDVCGQVLFIKSENFELTFE